MESVRSRFNPLITPVLTEVPIPSGLPMATTGWPILAASLSAKDNVGNALGTFTSSTALSV